MKTGRSGRFGRVDLEITGACPQDVLMRLAAQGTRIGPVQRVDELTLRVSVSAGQLPLIRRCAKQCMCELTVLKVHGLLPLLRMLGFRAAYPAVLIGLIYLVFWLQGHIWFISVSGNQTVPTEQILWTLEENGVGFWTETEKLDMNVLRNAVIDDLPALRWITVNTQGGFAQVEVRERAEKPVLSRDASPANIVARKSGVIEAVHASGGTSQVKPGDVVTQGELLISGVSNLDKTLLLTRAQGEVTARTWNSVSAIMPNHMVKKRYTGQSWTGWSVSFGKKTINFCKTSGISYREYDKIRKSVSLALPGGYTLPVAFTKTVCREYIPEAVPVEPEAAETAMTAAAERQLKQEMVAGVILSKDLALERFSDGYRLTGVAECREEIGNVAVIKD